MSGKLSDLDRRLIEQFDAAKPERLLAVYREKLEQLPRVSKLDQSRLEEFTRAIRHKLDLAEKRMNAGANWHEIQGLLSEARQWLLNAIYEPMVKRDAVKLAGSRKTRGSRWPELDDDIRAVLKDNIKTSAKAIFHTLPNSYDDEFDNKSYYVDGDVIIDKASGRKLGFSGFETRVTDRRNELKNSR